jgi:long-chain acyl-CoA synthetase
VFPSARIFNNYGCTEAMPRLTVSEVRDTAPTNGLIGWPLPGIDLRRGQGGALMFQSPFAAIAGYDGTALTPLDGWIATGDMARSTPLGWVLEGRSNDVFKRYGEKVSLVMLAQTVAGSWGGQHGFYFADGTSEPSHILVLAPIPTDPELREVLLGLRRSHPRSAWPARVEGTAVLPLSANGKLDTKALADDASRVVLWSQRI